MVITKEMLLAKLQEYQKAEREYGNLATANAGAAEAVLSMLKVLTEESAPPEEAE